MENKCGCQSQPWMCHVVCLAISILMTSCRFDLPQLPGVDAEAPLPLYLELLAGDIGGSGNLDETGTAARFNKPTSVAVDSAGNVYVADADNHTIRKIDVAGVVTTLAGTAGSSGSADGTGTAARFNNLGGVAVDSAGSVYVADTVNHTIRKVTAGGVVTTLAGTAGSSGSADGTGAEARFRYPLGVAVDSASNVYVADSSNQTIRKISAAGVVTTLAGTAGLSGSADSTGAAVRFSSPTNVAVDSAGNLYVTDQLNHTIRKVTAAGVVTTLAGSAGSYGSVDGPGAAARFTYPWGVAVDGAGNLYVSDSGNRTIRKITVNGVVTTLVGSAGSSFLSGVSIDSAGNIYVADQGNHTIRKITSAGAVMTLAGSARMEGSADGMGTAVRFRYPNGVAVDSAGNVYVADSGNSTIRKVTAAGVVTTLAGTAGSYGSVDGMGAAARFDIPSGVAVDSAGNIYVADSDTFTIRKVTAEGVVTTLAGTAGASGHVDGAGAAARFTDPYGVAVDSAGDVYVTDYIDHTIRKITAEGVVTTLAGTAGASGSADGTGAAARFNTPLGVAVDSAGNVYVADAYRYDIDTGNHTIRKITAEGVVTTLAGTAGVWGSADGTGAAARFNTPNSVAVDSAGNVYVTDRNNHTIRKITAEGTTTTIAGMAEVQGIDLGATPRFAAPSNLAIMGDSIVISDANAVLLLHHGAQ